MPVSNTLSSVIPTLFAQGLMALRSKCVMPKLVLNDWGTEVRQKGDTISVPRPSAISTADVTPAAYAPDTGNIAPDTATIPLSNWKEAAFTLNDKEVANAIAGVVPIQLSSAVEALARDVNSSIFALYKDIYSWGGTAGTTPFASDTTDVTTARKVLSKLKAPEDNRRFVIDPDAEAKALNLSAFQYYMYAGTDSVIRQGQIGEKLGFFWYMDQQVPTHTAGTITTGLAAKAATTIAVGDTTCTATTAASTGACALKKGDIIVFASDTQTYVLTADATQASANSDVTLNFQPGKAVSASGGQAITVKATHVNNLAFHRDAFAFASRPLAQDNLTNDGPDTFYTVPDPVSGLNLRLAYRREFHRTRLAFDLLWGVGTLRRELAYRLAG